MKRNLFASLAAALALCLAPGGIWELPFAKNAEGLGRTLAGGWQLAWIFQFGQRTALQLRFEVYNVLNHADLYLNDGSADISAGPLVTAFRRFTNTAGVPGDGQRRLQVGAKLEF